MKQNLTRKPVISRFFSVTGQNRYNWLDFFLKGNVFWRSWFNNLMVFEKAVLILKKWSWSCNFMILLHHC